MKNKHEITTNMQKDTNVSINVKEIVEVIGFVELAEDTYAMGLHFTFTDNENCKEVKNSKHMKDTNLDVEFSISNIDNKSGCGKMAITAIVNGKSVDYSIEDNLANEICSIALDLICEYNNLNMNSELDINIDNFSSNGILDDEELADAMYDLVSKDIEKYIPVANLVWNKIPLEGKETMANDLRKNEECLIDFVNYFKLKTIDSCSEETLYLIKDIVNKGLITQVTFDMLNDMADDTLEDEILNEIEEKANMDDICVTDEYLDDDLNTKMEDLAVELDKLDINYDIFNLQNDNSEVILIKDTNNREILWVGAFEDTYYVFEGGLLNKYGKVIIPMNSPVQEFDELQTIIDLVSKMSCAKKEKRVKEEKSNSRYKFLNEELMDKLDNMPCNFEIIGDYKENNVQPRTLFENNHENRNKAKSKKEFRREFLLNHIDELSDEDLLNELKRRMSSK